MDLSPEWTPVVCAHDCLCPVCEAKQGACDHEIEEGILCPHCRIAYADCPCPGPTQEDIYQYRLISGVLMARLRERTSDPTP